MTLDEIAAQMIMGFGLTLAHRPGENVAPPILPASPEDDGPRFDCLTVGDFLADPSRQSGIWIIDGPAGQATATWNGLSGAWDVA